MILYHSLISWPSSGCSSQTPCARCVSAPSSIAPALEVYQLWAPWSQRLLGLGVDGIVDLACPGSFILFVPLPSPRSIPAFRSFHSLFAHAEGLSRFTSFLVARKSNLKTSSSPVSRDRVVECAEKNKSFQFDHERFGC